MKSKTLKFPKSFLWGAACSSFQTEGAWREDGKSASSWDLFALKKGRIKGGGDARIAIDHYHRYKSDIKMMKETGLQMFRLSTSWPRIIPGGTGKVNEKGLDFYDRYIDEMLKAGIRPFVNLYHWDMPNVQELKGGWTNKETCYAFAEYGAAVARRLGDRVKDWMTFNELKHIWEGCYSPTGTLPGSCCPKK